MLVLGVVILAAVASPGLLLWLLDDRRGHRG